jgi:hypothetical protein
VMPMRSEFCFEKGRLVSDHVFENAMVSETNQVNIPRSTERHPPEGSS